VWGIAAAGPVRAEAFCSDFVEATSGCPTSGASSDGQGVSVRAEQRASGSSGVGSGRAAAGPRRGGSGPAKAAPEKKPVLVFARGTVTDLSGLPVPAGPEAARCSPCAPRNFSVTVSDLVNFTPSAPTVAMEPNGWAVVRVPANFIAQSSPELHAGALLGYEAEVRFTPVRYDWNYGDGIRRSTSTGGQTWQTLGVPEFSETPTSHAYTVAGRFAAQVEASFTAEYRFAGQQWNDVSGIVTAASDTFEVLVGQAKTVLVSEDCAIDRSGPGC